MSKKKKFEMTESKMKRLLVKRVQCTLSEHVLEDGIYVNQNNQTYKKCARCGGLVPIQQENFVQ